MTLTEQHIALAADIKKALGGWRKFTIAIDGVDGSGKSTLGRILSLHLDMPLIETDMLLDGDRPGFNYRGQDLLRLIDARHRHNRPVIIEGVCILKILGELGVTHDYLVDVERENHFGTHAFQEMFASYESRYKKDVKSNFIFNRGRDD